MGLIEEEIKEIRIMNKQFQDGKIGVESVAARVSMYAQTEKRARLMLQAFIITAKYNRSILKKIIKTNLIGDAQAIDINVDLEKEKIVCPLTDEPITRAACLDYSGGHNNDCAGCENKKITQDRLLGEKV